MRTKLIRTLFGLGVVGVLALIPAAVVAQVQTGTITGVLVDEQGAVLPGVAITLQSEALIVPKNTFTNERGSYTFISLPPGTYELTFDMQGFGTVNRQGVIVNVAVTTTVDHIMRLATVQETITVTAESPAVDTKSASKGTNFDESLLENIPQAREIWSTVEQVPGATMSKFNVGGAESAQQSRGSIHGSMGSQQEYAIEGLKLNWPGSDGGATAFYFDHDSYAEINIMTNGANAEVGTSGIYMNMVTKSGGNMFSGGSSIYWEDDSFQSDNVSDELREQGVTSGNPINFLYDFNVHLGGPIVRDKVWFFGSYRRYDINRQILGVFREDGSPAPDVNHQTNAIGKVTAQLNERDKIMANVNFNYQNRFYRRAGAQFVEEVASRRQIEPAYILQGQYQSLVSDKFFLDARYGYLHLIFPLDYQDAVGPDDLALLDIIQSTLKVAALERFENIATRHQFNISATYFVDDWGGTHNFKTGFEFGRANNGWERSANGNLARRLFDGEPHEVQTYNFPITSENIIDTFSLYLQDSWTAGRNLTLNYGVRFEKLVGFAPEQGRPGNEFFPGEDYPKLENIPNWNNLAWRLGVTYDVTGDGKTAIKGFAGQFLIQEGTRLVEQVNPNARGGDYRSWDDVNGDFLPQFEELGPPTRPYGGLVNRIDDDITRPYSDEFNIGVERELMPNVNFGVTYYRRQNRNLISGINLAVPESSYTEVQVEGAGGPVTAYEQDEDTLGLADRVITNIDDLRHTFNGVEFTFTKRMADNWQLVAGYTTGKNEGLYDSGLNDDFNNPNFNINREGAVIGQDSTHLVKLIGTYVFPRDFTASTNVRYFTGQPVLAQHILRGLNQGTVTISADPRGTDRLDNVTLWDVRVSKIFNTGERSRIEVSFDVFNLLNQSSATSIITTVGANYGTISQILPPRVARLGLSWKF